MSIAIREMTGLNDGREAPNGLARYVRGSSIGVPGPKVIAVTGTRSGIRSVAVAASLANTLANMRLPVAYLTWSWQRGNQLQWAPAAKDHSLIGEPLCGRLHLPRNAMLRRGPRRRLAKHLNACRERFAHVIVAMPPVSRRWLRLSYAFDGVILVAPTSTGPAVGNRRDDRLSAEEENATDRRARVSIAQARIEESGGFVAAIVRDPSCNNHSSLHHGTASCHH